MIERKELTKRFNRIDPLSIQDYVDTEGYKMLKKAFTMKPSDIIEEIKLSRITGRGGAGFPTALKMKYFAEETGTKYIICNADESEPGNFKDRYLMEQDPHQIIEGMIISAYATGASHGYIYIRGEYQTCITTMKHTIKEAKKHQYLGTNILETGFDFDIEVRRGAGAYVCGEEFALIESIEGKTGRTRVKPPYPAQAGLHQRPTLINNVETFCNLPFIVRIGGDEYSTIGSSYETGTKLISLSGNVKNKGLYEVPYGRTIREVIETLGGGTTTNRPIKMVQLGGASGVIIPETLLDMAIDNERFDTFHSKIGSGAIIVMDDTHDLFDVLTRNMEFFADESCGKCTPCREGTIQLYKLVETIKEGKGTFDDITKLQSLANHVKESSLCGLGTTAPNSILSTLQYFYDEYVQRTEKNQSNSNAGKGLIDEQSIRTS